MGHLQTSLKIVLFLSIFAAVSLSAFAQYTFESVGIDNETTFFNNTLIEMECNVSFTSGMNENNTINLTLYHNLNGTWEAAVNNISNITDNNEGLTVLFPYQLSNKSNGSFSYACLAENNATDNRLADFSTNKTLKIYHNFSITNDQFVGLEALPFSTNIFVDFIIDGPSTQQTYFAEDPGMIEGVYNCTLTPY